MSDTNDLPSSFWALPESSLNETLQIIYHTLVARLRDEFRELPGFGTLEEMLIERICFMYVHQRHKEQVASFANDRAYKEFIQLWDQMSGHLRKMRQSNTDEIQLRNRILRGVRDALNSVFVQMPIEEAAPLKAQFAEAIENVDY